MDQQAYSQSGGADGYWPSPKRQRLSTSPGPTSGPAPVPAIIPSSHVNDRPAVVIEKPLISNDLPVDYRLLLLSLAEQYVTEAQRQAVLIAYRQKDANVETYCKLISTALVFYSTVLQRHKLDLSPRQESSIQLRYGSLMFEATENVEDLETFLSRAIQSCERNRLIDLKYSMQHLLARVMFKSNPKPGLKYLDGLINDATTSNHVPWIYAFHFLRCSLSLQLNKPNENQTTLQSLQSIADMSRQKGDWAIQATSAAMEATLYLRTQPVDFVSEAQRAIANCRAALMRDPNHSLEWLHFLVEYLALACSLDPLELATAREKVDRVIQLRSQLQQALKNLEEPDSSTLVSIPIHSSISNSTTTMSGGLFTKDSNGMDYLKFSWLSRRERLSLYFSLVPLYLQSHRTQALQHLEDGLQWCQRPPRLQQEGRAITLASECRHAQWQSFVRCQVLILLTVARCEDSQYEKAKSSLQQLWENLQDPALGHNSNLRCLAQYITGVVQQATGDLEAAFQTYNNITPLHQPVQDVNVREINHTIRDVAVLSRLNVLLIIRPQNHPYHHLLEPILESLKPHFSASPSNTSTMSQNRSLVAAYEFLHTILSPDAIIDTKIHLQRSLKLAKDAANLQLIALGTSYLYSFMFRGILGEKALQYANHSLSTARSSKSKTLQCVASGLVAEALELEGKVEEATGVRRQAEGLVPWLPSSLQQLKQ